MFQYDTTIDPASDNTSHGLLIAMVGGGKTVLDLGCATGYLAEALASRGCQVSGVEYVPEAAEKARPFLHELVVGDLNTLDLAAEFTPGSFDVLVFGDILEHLADPVAVLRGAVRLLKPGGSVVISVPNVSHGSVRLALLQGRWQYTTTGLLDRTHIRFFTRRSLLELVTDCGLAAVDVRPTTADPLGVEVDVDAENLPAGVVDWVRAQPDALTYQFVVRAVLDDADGAVARLAVSTAEAGAQLEQLESRLEDEQDRRVRAEQDLVRLRATRTLRLLEGPRRLYAAIRRAVDRAPQ